jgi:LacI family transcriptional regulator
MIHIMKKKNSIIEIAKKAGVSTATVSRVINNNDGYGEETKKKVLRTIKECGYMPNLNAASLRTHRSNCIGVIVPDITNEFFARLVRELEIFFIDKRYTLLICDTNEDSRKEQIQIKNLLERNVDAIIYISGQDIISDAENIHSIPLVYIDRCPRNAQILIQSDNVFGGYIATKELLEKGCRKILLMRDKRNVSTVVERKKGYLNALNENEIAYDTKLELCIMPEYDDAKTTIERILAKSDLFFDGIFCTADMIALGCVNGLQNLGYSIPRDVKIVGFDNVSISKFCNPPITTVTQHTKDLAVRTGQTVLSLIAGENISNTNIIIPVSLERRETT